MPFLSFQVSPEKSVEAAGRIIKETGAELVAVGCPQCTTMLEGVVEPRPQIKDIAELVADVLLEKPAPVKKPAAAKPESMEVH